MTVQIDLAMVACFVAGVIVGLGVAYVIGWAITKRYG